MKMISKFKNILQDLTPLFLWRYLHNLKKLILVGKQHEFSDEVVENIYQFFATFQDFRTNGRCSTELGYDISIVEKIKKQLYKDKRLGTYSLGLNGPPHALMREYIQSRFDLTENSLILEIGPGANPLFPKGKYMSTNSIDKYAVQGWKLFYGNVTNSISTADFQGSYSTIDQITEIADIIQKTGKFEFVVGCHSFEHETRPLKGLRNIYSILRKGGHVILFVPDGYSDDISIRDSTHAMYLTPDMIQELFEEIGGFKNLSIEPFRPNLDIVISAKKV